MSPARSTLRACLLLLAAAWPCAQAASPPPWPPIRHVFVLLLENQSEAETFGHSSRAPYLARTLPAQGARLPQYYGIGHASLGNYVALISGQAPNHETQLDCAVFSEFRPTAASVDAHGQLAGLGCVYPAVVRTLPDQLEEAGFSWRAYMEDMGNNRAREPATCAHVAVGTADNTEEAQIGDQYAARHNPFVYFHSIIDDQKRCDHHVVNLALLPQDLKSAATTPNYVFITPNLCNDGHDAPCVDGRPGGLREIDAFLRRWVPLITQSPAFRADGLLVITFDESDHGGSEGVAACCGERPLPGAKYPPGISGPGGGRVGAVLLSPFVRPGTVSRERYNHYSLLGTVESIFGLPPLGYAAEPDLRLIGRDVFNDTAPRSSR
ncbi:MAG: phosphoesterase [Proteobacteria bacterium]|nr:phosphoesterase [Pseudomonadota bacterium]